MLRRVVASRLSDIELLRIEIDTLWIRDEDGRLVRDGALDGVAAPHLVIACATGGGHLMAVGERVPATLADEMRALVAWSEPSADAATRPPVLDRCREVLADSLGALEVTSGPSYVAESLAAFRSTVEIRSAGEERGSVPAAGGGRLDRRGGGCWRGSAGPWAMALVAGQIVRFASAPG
jgi:hypothetical protein